MPAELSLILIDRLLRHTRAHTALSLQTPSLTLHLLSLLSPSPSPSEPGIVLLPCVEAVSADPISREQAKTYLLSSCQAGESRCLLGVLSSICVSWLYSWRVWVLFSPQLCSQRIS